MKSLPDVAQDFDRIAAALAATPSDRRLTIAEMEVVRAVPAHARSALDVGCGDGRLAQELARRGLHVTAIDISPEMISLARCRTAGEALIDYRVGDVLDPSLVGQSYDAVVSVNVVHHAPLDRIVPRLANLVAPGGVLVIQDVVNRPGLRNLPVNVVAAVWARTSTLCSKRRASRDVRELYAQHGDGEVYLEPRDVRRALSVHLTGVRVTHHLAWRYTAVWTRDAQGSEHSV